MEERIFNLTFQHFSLIFEIYTVAAITRVVFEYFFNELTRLRLFLCLNLRINFEVFPNIIKCPQTDQSYTEPRVKAQQSVSEPLYGRWSHATYQTPGSGQTVADNMTGDDPVVNVIENVLVTDQPHANYHL